ncbi:hypothetical protein EG327_007285 [Venturia inaequalis]|uniref:Uncharacterized protein n=1 Tax=Venturia inaequalis TaxID=5025 RepID=A0A8H3Z2X9_VENIN|nr:hypothetical protein EG327_007285 [Venturia inaequalis]
MSPNVINKEERAALASRVGLVKKRKAEAEVPRVIATTKPLAPLRSILTNGTSPYPVTPPPTDSSISSASPPESKRKREGESESVSCVSKKIKQAHAHSNVDESNGKKRKHSQDAGEVDTASPRKKINEQNTPFPRRKSSSLRIPAPITSPTTTPPINTAAKPRKPHYTPQNPPPNTRFTGLRWNPAIRAWESKFTPLPTPSTSATTSPQRTLTPLYPFGLNPHTPRASINMRKVLLPHDASLDNRWRDRLAEMDEEVAIQGREGRDRRQQWEWEIDGEEEEDEDVVVEGKEGSSDGEGSQEGRLDAVKAEELRARAARRGRRSS